MVSGNDVEILNTNLQPFFWKKVKAIIRQNKKAALQEFLFNTVEVNQDQTVGSSSYLEDQIAALKNQVNSLQQKVIHLEAKLFDLTISHSASFEENQKLNMLSAADSSSKIAISNLKPGDSTSKSEKGAYLGENDSKTRKEIIQSEQQSNTFSEASKMPLKPLSKNQQYNISSNQNKAQNRVNFIILGNLSEEEKIKIIQTGFRLNQEGKIPLKKYYESTQEYSLFQFKGYFIKYESIRCTKLYQQLKDN